MTLAGQRISIWYSLVIGRKYYYLAHVYDLITYLNTYLHSCLLVDIEYLLAYLLAILRAFYL